MITERDQLLNMVYDLRNVVHLSMPERCEIADALYKLIKDRPDWTPCAEELPENEKEVLLTCVSSRKRIYECKGYYLAKYSEEIGCADDLESDYDEETDRNYCPEGFYECIENWCDYSFVYINDTVLAWQPLPKPWTGGLDGK